MHYKSNALCKQIIFFDLSIHEIILKKCITVSTKNIKQFNNDNKKTCFLCSKST